MKIAFFEVTQEWERKIIKDKFSKEEIMIFEEPIHEIEPLKLIDIEVVSVFIYSKCTKEMLKKLPNLKFIGTRSTGYNHIDLNYCKEKNIVVCYVPHYGENTVAEFTMGLLLMISRKLIDSVNRVKSGSFDFTGLRGFDLAQKTIGIIGFGNIGQKFVNICNGFEMNILVYDVNAEKFKDKAKKLKVTFVDLDSLYAQSDIISLHIPLLPQTKHILNSSAFNKMKNGVIILNTSRGDLIESKALIDALNSKKVGFAGIDVLEGECFIKDEIELLNEDVKKICDMQIMIEDHILINHPKIIVTPHNAFNTIDALERILKTSIYNVNSFIHNQCRDNRLV